MLLTGRVAHDEVPGLLAAMDMAILPSAGDYTSPVKLFEFMACAVPPIAPDFEPIQEVVVEGETGWMFKAGDLLYVAGNTQNTTEDNAYFTVASVSGIELVSAAIIADRPGAAGAASADADYSAEMAFDDVVTFARALFEAGAVDHVFTHFALTLRVFRAEGTMADAEWTPRTGLDGLRAAEEGIPVLRATPTGISAVIDARGSVVKSLPWRTAGVIDAVLPPPANSAPPFARLGNLIPLLMALLLIAGGIVLGRRRR